MIKYIHQIRFVRIGHRITRFSLDTSKVEDANMANMSVNKTGKKHKRTQQYSIASNKSTFYQVEQRITQLYTTTVPFMFLK